MRIPLDHIRRRAKERPDGYIEEVLSLGRIEGDDLVMEDASYRALLEKYGGPPGLKALTTNFAGAVARFVKQGLPVLSQQEFDKRLAICRACPSWQAVAGTEDVMQCAECGCLKLKLWLGSEQCPVRKW